MEYAAKKGDTINASRALFHLSWSVFQHHCFSLVFLGVSTAHKHAFFPPGPVELAAKVSNPILPKVKRIAYRGYIFTQNHPFDPCLVFYPEPEISSKSSVTSGDSFTSVFKDQVSPSTSRPSPGSFAAVSMTDDDPTSVYPIHRNLVNHPYSR